MAGQLQGLGLVRVKSQFRAHSLQLTSCAGTSWKEICHGYGRDFLQDQTSCSLQALSSGGWMQLRRERQRLLQSGLCHLGEPVTP